VKISLLRKSAQLFVLTALGLQLCACSTFRPVSKGQAAEACLSIVNVRLEGHFSAPSPPHATPAVQGDFDGDERDDVACLGMKAGSDVAWLFVVLASEKKKPQVFSLEHFSPDTPSTDIRILHERPNSFTTRCGYMPDECAPDARLILDLNRDSIFLVVLGASGVLIYWDETALSFKREWLID